MKEKKKNKMWPIQPWPKNWQCSVQKQTFPQLLCSYPELFQRKLEIKTCLTRTYPVAIYIYFWGERRFGFRLRRTGSDKKVRRKNNVAIFPSYLPMRPRAPQPNPQSSLTPKTNVNSDWVRV